ncbi:MAG TPA: DNA polymerase IV [Lachnospiraceae bacterium]|nr:DNA polymerase IV [Lachnospiraceae bacterium]
MKQIFFHIDVNSAFLSWSALEKLKNGCTTDLRSIASIIGGDSKIRHGVVLAKSVPSKIYQIQTGEPIVNALRKCPNLIIEPPNMPLYQEQSFLLMDYLANICPDIEQLSIDECYMYYTPISSRFSTPYDAALYIKDSIAKKFGYTVNIGISDKKVLAKMASDFEKPNFVHTLYTKEIQEKIWKLPVSKLYMCGKSSVETLKNLGIKTIGELANADLNILQGHLKSHGKTLWEYANGIDDTTIQVLPNQLKGIGNSTTLASDVITKEAAYHTLLLLAESVSSRLRKSNQLCCLVSTEIKYNTFKSISHQMTLQIPANNCDEIYQCACLLFDEMWNSSPIRLLGIRTSKLVSNSEPRQLNLFSEAFLLENKKTYDGSTMISRSKLHKLDVALDEIKEKYGNNAIVRGSLLPINKKPPEHL